MEFFFQPLSVINVNSFFLKRLQSLVGHRVIDLLLYFPDHFKIRSYIENTDKIIPSNDYVMKVKIISHNTPLNKKHPYKVICSIPGGLIILNFFNYKSGYLHNLFKIGSTVIIAGRVEIFDKQFIINHPDYVLSNDINQVPDILNEPIYRLTSGITNQFLRKIISKLLKGLPQIDNWFPNLINFHDALINAHTSSNNKDAKERLSMDEILITKLALQDLRAKNKQISGIIINCHKDISHELSKIPFELTNDQKKAIEEIKEDFESPFPMSRLLQGDVGSGKTIVAIIASIYALNNSLQVAVLAPTEILARQHYTTFTNFFGLEICGLFISSNKRQKKNNLVKLASGEIKIAIGTHALIQEDICFQKLGLVIIDEQHKFGVEQRARLISKGSGANILYMSATPIPRTLMLAISGDMDISIIREKPKGRKPIITSVLNIQKLSDIVGRLSSHTGKVYWICPLIEESEKINLSPAVTRYEYLKEFFNEDVMLVHGKTKDKDRENIMEEFKNSTGFKILVATTVIEVGVDVPDADIIIIENAERFGLAQLHQLRGRVGRGQEQAFCILLYNGKLSLVAHKRLTAIKDSNDGFMIAEQDLSIRGAGDMLGKQQTGIQEFMIADPTNIALIKKLDTEPQKVTMELKNFYFKVFKKNITV